MKYRFPRLRVSDGNTSTGNSHLAMNPRDIGKSYDELADRWNSPAFDRNNGIQQHQRALSFCEQKQWALDVGCGCSGRIIDLLICHGFKVEGIDVSQRMISLARQRHPEVCFHCSDICDWKFTRKYDLVSAWDSIWHVPLDKQEKVLLKMLDSLTPGGVCIFSIGGLNHESEKVDSAMGPNLYYSTLGIPRTLQLVTEVGCTCRHLEYDQYPELHLYMVVQRP